MTPFDTIHDRIDGVWADRGDLWPRYVRWGVRTFPRPVRIVFWGAVATALLVMAVGLITLFFIGGIALVNALNKSIGTNATVFIALVIILFGCCVHVASGLVKADKQKRKNDEVRE